jgi:hypothetical protein
MSSLSVWVPPQPLDLVLLEDAQQLGLHVRAQAPDLVQEDRPAVGQLEAAEPPLVGPREGPLLVAEQLARNVSG